MSIPLDRLYNHLSGLCNHDTVIYRFNPHGSRKVEDIDPIDNLKLHTRLSLALKPAMLCYDQEPIICEYSVQEYMAWFQKRLDSSIFAHDHPAPKLFEDWIEKMHIRSVLGNRCNVWDKIYLVHSEKRSHAVEQMTDKGCIPIYWWNHAALAADWFRYAKHDPCLQQSRNPKYDFLIYNRAWSGSREYRLKFSEMLVDHDLVTVSKMKFSSQCDGTHYVNHRYVNDKFRVCRQDLDQWFEPNFHSANDSADYNNTDYQQSAIEVVLETLFDDSRIYLTEKILRPIACAQPFLLAGPAGSLAYLRSYGFETFDPVIDESYDLEHNSSRRLQMIINEMKRISLLNHDEKTQLWAKLWAIAERNKRRFFDDQWQQSIFDEFVCNYQQARLQMPATGHWTSYFRQLPDHRLDKSLEGHGDVSELYREINQWLLQKTRKTV